MQIECTHENLRRAISAASRAVATRASLPVLGTILLQTQKGRLRIAATDLEIGMEFFVGAKIQSEGQLALPARLTNDVVSALGGKTVSIKGSENEAIFSADGMTTTVRGLDPNEFPLIPELKDGVKIVLTAAELQTVVSDVGYAAALDQTRPVLTGVLWKAEGNKATVVATDSYRLAELQIPLKEGPAQAVSCIVPARALAEGARMFEQGEVAISFAEHQIVFQGEEARLVSRLLEGEFPNYEAIIPKEHTTTATFSALEGAQALRVATLFARDNANTVTVKTAAPNQLSVHATSAQSGETNATITATVEGEPVEASFNVRYLLDMVGTQKEEVSILFKGATDPAILTTKQNPELRYLVMPLKTS